MSKRALIVACSYTGTQLEQKGTQADVQAIGEMLKDCYGIEYEDSKYINETGQYSESPTGTNVRTAFKEIATSCAEGDSLFFYFTGCGVRIPTPWEDPPKWGLLITDFDVLTREDFNDVLASLPAGCRFTAAIDASCGHGMFPHPIANDAQEKERLFKEGGRFVGIPTYLNLFNERYPESGMAQDNAAEVLLATFPEKPSLFAQPVAEGVEEGDELPRRRHLWGSPHVRAAMRGGYCRVGGPVAEGDEGAGEEIEEIGDEGRERRERRDRNDEGEEEGRRRRRERRRRRRRDDGEEGEEDEEDEEDGEFEEGDEDMPAAVPVDEDGEPLPVEEGAAFLVEEGEEAPPAEEAPAEEEPPAEEEAPPAEEVTPEEEGGEEGFSLDQDFPAPSADNDGSVDPEMGSLLAAGMFRGYVKDTEEGGPFTRALVAAVRAVKKEDPEATISNLSVMEMICAAMEEGGFKMSPALVCSDANSEAPFIC